MSVLAASPAAVAQLEVVADTGHLGQGFGSIADQVYVADRRGNFAIFDHVAFGHAEDKITIANVDLAAGEGNAVNTLVDRADDVFWVRFSGHHVGVGHPGHRVVLKRLAPAITRRLCGHGLSANPVLQVGLKNAVFNQDVFARGVARAIGVKDNVTSPSFTLINEYKGDFVLYHMDFYRLNSVKEILDIGVEDYFYSDSICLVEWAEKMNDMFPENAIWVIIRHKGNRHREITIEKPEKR